MQVIADKISALAFRDIAIGTTFSCAYGYYVKIRNIQAFSLNSNEIKNLAIDITCIPRDLVVIERELFEKYQEGN